ncbi:DeoR family transcriptional regulator [Mangrovibacillus cuniculi]|uniref:DeoR/GlpR transcriptional regulator n=1 Tax=Mangrovibacillus cuniculi TaxID=2593652 RepID=A0A7S8C926_9BACI|nr:DeoR family transcriptional regulator [Mangrovibacillus cuniculi]QPC45627.1 DeoR/GlpR transcriptional regulator [Mangrovibacillus cuniculi]
MLPAERKEQLIEWLRQEKYLKISEISKRLNVSEMTVYRDVHQLVEEKLVEKTPNGISLKVTSSVSSNDCVVCFKPATSRLSMKFVKKSQEVVSVCCPHCALLHMQHVEEEVLNIIGQDYLMDTTINGRMGYYVLQSSLPLKCCEPQALLFSSESDAIGFTKGFGGEVHTFESARRTIEMQMTKPCCSKGE